MTMHKCRHALPQVSGRRMLTDSGLETTLIYLDGLELPCFASFQPFASEAGRATLRRYFDRHAELAVSRGFGFIADTPTWRASRDWGAQLGFEEDALARISRRFVSAFAIVTHHQGRTG